MLNGVPELNQRYRLQKPKSYKSHSEIRVDIRGTKWLYSRFIARYPAGS